MHIFDFFRDIFSVFGAFSRFLGVKFGFRKSCLCKRNDKYEVCDYAHHVDEGLNKTRKQGDSSQIGQGHLKRCLAKALQCFECANTHSQLRVLHRKMFLSFLTESPDESWAMFA